MTTQEQDDARNQLQQQKNDLDRLIYDLDVREVRLLDSLNAQIAERERRIVTLEQQSSLQASLAKELKTQLVLNDQQSAQTIEKLQNSLEELRSETEKAKSTYQDSLRILKEEVEKTTQELERSRTNEGQARIDKEELVTVNVKLERDANALKDVVELLEQKIQGLEAANADLQNNIPILNGPEQAELLQQLNELQKLLDSEKDKLLQERTQSNREIKSLKRTIKMNEERIISQERESKPKDETPEKRYRKALEKIPIKDKQIKDLLNRLNQVVKEKDRLQQKRQLVEEEFKLTSKNLLDEKVKVASLEGQIQSYMKDLHNRDLEIKALAQTVREYQENDKATLAEKNMTLAQKFTRNVKETVGWIKRHPKAALGYAVLVGTAGILKLSQCQEGYDTGAQCILYNQGRTYYPPVLPPRYHYNYNS